VKQRSRARGWALQVLYAWEARRPSRDIDDVLEEFLTTRRIHPDSRAYLRSLVGLVETHLRDIDASLSESLTNWRLERLSVIDRNVLRIGAAELLHADDVPPRAALQEAIILAEKYGTDESPRFVNGVLDALMHARSGEGAGGRERR